ncbi:hypothetical protein C9374_000699 [Naegleria lovaniensis]|uniref:Uncharacterized protein n=1 Tax=Naegleria lovaniensis TaxID=51637 RepID=A0AA88GTE5_NAELO|nr:uncharacterized protein C9374_000699 [Naegleria lovaniensis]KAG2388535.1 hypothetical protein C9374_000699 [Naegleria lovaniensis]
MKWLLLSLAGVMSILMCWMVLISIRWAPRRSSPQIVQYKPYSLVKCPVVISETERREYVESSSKEIPKIIYQSYIPNSEEELSDSMKQAMNSFKVLNPDYSHKYFGDDAALQILIDNFGNDSDEVFAFRNLIPGAFKIDFWRYAMLWLFGGFYADADMMLLEPFEKWISPNSTFVIPLEKIGFGFHNGFIGSVPKHPILRIAMDMVIYNVKTKFLPRVPNKIIPAVHADLAVSGPILLGKVMNRYINEPDEVKHNIPLLRSKNVQVIGFCANNKNDDDTYYTVSLSQECTGTKLAKVKFEQFQKEHATKTESYTKLFQERKVFL